MKILITGVCGFIGFHLTKKLAINKKYKIFGIDNFDNYYSINLKKKRKSELLKIKNFKFYKIDLTNSKKLDNFIKKNKFNTIFHLAAQAGVRYSIQNPKKYIRNNISAFFNLLESAKKNDVKKLFYASSSSVYGDSNKFPLKENQILKTKNLYSLSKEFNEKLSSVFSNFYNMNLIGLRFFTAYGEWGRPDMMMMKYILAKKNKKKFFLYNYGKHLRDFTYIDDLTNILKLMINKRYKKKHDVFNICSSKTIKITSVLKLIDKYIPNKVVIKRVSLQKADVLKTFGSNKKIIKLTNYKKFTPIQTGVKNLCDWAKKFYNL
tara:strand:+ start:1628 stop:2587 length:960 start_codon:yes stop_codon:yes gene_type:complete